MYMENGHCTVKFQEIVILRISTNTKWTTLYMYYYYRYCAIMFCMNWTGLDSLDIAHIVLEDTKLHVFMDSILCTDILNITYLSRIWCTNQLWFCNKNVHLFNISTIVRVFCSEFHSSILNVNCTVVIAII